MRLRALFLAASVQEGQLPHEYLLAVELLQVVQSRRGCATLHFRGDVLLAGQTVTGGASG